MDYRKLQASNGDTAAGRLFGVIADRQPGGVTDGVASEAVFSTSDLAQIHQLGHQAVLDSHAEAGIFCERIEDIAQKMVMDTAWVRRTVEDGFFNPMTGAGTTSDPGTYNTAFVPMSITPDQATALYSSGGIASRIINKKAEGALAAGYSFHNPRWAPASLAAFHDYCESKELGQIMIRAMTDSLVYGGGVIVPALKGDNPITYQKSFAELIADGRLGKGTVDYLWTADRWNAVIVPDYDLSAKSYLTPSTLYVPIAGKEINTSRTAILRMQILPYWGVIRQMGWSMSDFEGYMRSIMAYKIAITTIPIMAQQSSLLYHHVPLDGIIAQNGPAAAREWAKENSEALKKWSMFEPKTVNSFGEIKTIDRTYTGFDMLIKILQQNIGAEAEIPESDIFYTKAESFTTNESDVTLRKADVLQRLGRTLASQMQPVLRVMAVSCFGPGSPEVETLADLRMETEIPTPQTSGQKADSGVKFAGCLGQLMTAGLQLGDAVAIAKQFFPDVEITQDMMARIKPVAGGEVPAQPGGLFGLFGPMRHGNG